MLKKEKSTTTFDMFEKSTSEPSFADAFHYSQQAVLTRGMLGPLSAFYRDRKADECNQICRGFAQQFVEEAIAVTAAKKQDNTEKKGKQKHVFSHELASRTSDPRRILDELMNVLLAGRDTTASLLGNLFFALAKNPRIWKKLRDEVAVLQGKPPTYEQLRQLKYTQHCVNESLRLHPVVPRNERRAIRDTVLPLGGGKDGLAPVFVPKGTLVAYNIYAMHRRTDIYGPDVEEFGPERWEGGTLQPRWGYLPFNGGPRICIGQRYALTEVSYVLVRLVQEFRALESRDPGPWEESLALTLCSRNGTKVGLIH
ncbi:putative cytochrome P450 alkane hydroxylase [Aspergillus unguis]